MTAFNNPFDVFLEDETAQINTSKSTTNPEITTQQSIHSQFLFENFTVPLQTSEPTFPADELSNMTVDMTSTPVSSLNEDGDPPLLEDIGVDLGSIKERLLLSITLKAPTDKALEHVDLAGPILIALTLGFQLMLAGEIHFGDIYGMSISGTLVLYFLLNFLSEINDVMPVYNVMSALGYSLSPMLVLGLIHVFINLSGMGGMILGLAAAVWSTLGATSFFEACLKLHNKKWLVGYPVFLFYMSFVLITIF